MTRQDGPRINEDHLRQGSPTAGAIGLSAKVLAQTHGSSVGATAPATIATPTTVATPCYYALT